MSEIETVYEVVLSSAGVPKVHDRARIYRRGSDRSLVLKILTQGKDPADQAELSHQATLEGGTPHFTGQSALGYRIDVTFHRNYLGDEFIYGRTGPPGGGPGKLPGRGGTGVWVAEEEEAGRGDGAGRPKENES